MKIEYSAQLKTQTEGIQGWGVNCVFIETKSYKVFYLKIIFNVGHFILKNIAIIGLFATKN